MCTGERECVVGMRERETERYVYLYSLDKQCTKHTNVVPQVKKKKERRRSVHKLAIFLASHEVMAISVQTTFNLTKYDVISTIVM